MPINKFTDESEEPRLKVRKKEEELYVNYILQSKKEFSSENPTHTEFCFINNFKAIGDYLAVFQNDVLRELARYILENVCIIFVKTDSFASSYILFHVLNTRGLSLKQSDLLKNKLFEIAECKNKSSGVIEKCWSNIEDIIEIENLDKFLNIYETSRKTTRNRVSSDANLAENLSRLAESNDFNKNVIDFVHDLEKSAKNYKKIKEANFKDGKTQDIIQLLIDNMPDEWIPPVLSFLNKKGENSHEFIEFVNLFEKCYLHQWFLKGYKTKREAICYNAIELINTNEYFCEIKLCLTSHANNSAMLNYFDSDIYEQSNSFKLSRYILFKIDQEMQDSSVSKTYSGTITIEHILPQNMENPYWSRKFSFEDHKQWVHKLGNLTLLSGIKNSKAKNSDFDTKLSVYKANGKNVSFDIAKNVLEYTDWNLKNLKHRHESLLEFAKLIWFVEKNQQISFGN